MRSKADIKAEIKRRQDIYERKKAIKSSILYTAIPLAACAVICVGILVSPIPRYSESGSIPEIFTTAGGTNTDDSLDNQNVSSNDGDSEREIGAAEGDENQESIGAYISYSFDTIDDLIRWLTGEAYSAAEDDASIYTDFGDGTTSADRFRDFINDVNSGGTICVPDFGDEYAPASITVLTYEAYGLPCITYSFNLNGSSLRIAMHYIPARYSDCVSYSDYLTRRFGNNCVNITNWQKHSDYYDCRETAVVQSEQAAILYRLKDGSGYVSFLAGCWSVSVYSSAKVINDVGNPDSNGNIVRSLKLVIRDLY